MDWRGAGWMGEEAVPAGGTQVCAWWEGNLQAGGSVGGPSVGRARFGASAELLGNLPEGSSRGSRHLRTRDESRRSFHH